MVPFQVVTQQRRRTDIVGHRQVEIAVLVDVHRGAAPTDTGKGAGRRRTTMTHRETAHRR